MVPLRRRQSGEAELAIITDPTLSAHTKLVLLDAIFRDRYNSEGS